MVLEARWLQHHMASIAKTLKKNIGFFKVFGTSASFACCIVGLIFGYIFGLIFVSFGGPKSPKNQSKIDPIGTWKKDAMLDGFWMALGSIFGAFGKHLGEQNGAKLALTSEGNRCQDDVEK